jgi:hypothetical protein
MSVWLMEKIYELRQGDRVLARLMVSETGEVTLDHDLTEDALSMSPVVVPFYGSGRLLRVQIGSDGGRVTVSFSDITEVQLKLGADEELFLKARDTKGLVRLRAAIPTSDPGSIGNQPIHESHLVLELVPSKVISKWWRGAKFRVGE